MPIDTSGSSFVIDGDYAVEQRPKGKWTRSKANRLRAIPAASPAVVLHDGHWLPGQRRIVLHFHLTVKTIHVHQYNYSFCTVVVHDLIPGIIEIPRLSRSRTNSNRFDTLYRYDAREYELKSIFTSRIDRCLLGASKLYNHSFRDVIIDNKIGLFLYSYHG